MANSSSAGRPLVALLVGISVVVLGAVVMANTDAPEYPPSRLPAPTYSSFPPDAHLTNEQIKERNLFRSCEGIARRIPNNWDKYPCNKFPRPSGSPATMPSP